jgi:hypothetical protein
VVIAPPRTSWLTSTPNSTSVITRVANAPTIKMAYRAMAECAGPAVGSSSSLDFPARPKTALDPKTRNATAVP